jgi:hypothetical protein
MLSYSAVPLSTPRTRSGLGQNGFPGVVLRAGHVVLGMVAGHGHEGKQPGLLDAFGFQLSQDVIQRGLAFPVPTKT